MVLYLYSHLNLPETSVTCSFTSEVMQAEGKICQHVTPAFALFTTITTASTLQTQANEIEEAVKEEFEKLHLFLREEEDTRLKVLKQEEEIKIQVMSEKLKTIKDQIKTLSSTISDIEAALRVEDLQFLQVHSQPIFTQLYRIFFQAPKTRVTLSYLSGHLLRTTKAINRHNLNPSNLYFL